MWSKLRPPERGHCLVALILTALSLTHLSDSIQLVTNCPGLGSLGLSRSASKLGFVMLEINQMTARQGAQVHQQVGLADVHRPR